MATRWGSTQTCTQFRDELADTPHIADPNLTEPVESERLARRWFATVARGAFDELAELVHDDVQLASRVRPGMVIEGRDDVTRFLVDTVAASLYEAAPEAYFAIDATRVTVEGRMRWKDDERVIRDDPMVWAMEFRDGLVLRFLHARSVLEAEALLASER